MIRTHRKDHVDFPGGSDKSLCCYCSGHWFNSKEGKKDHVKSKGDCHLQTKREASEEINLVNT